MRENKKAPVEGVKDTFTLRIPEITNESLKQLSKETGISQNSLILMFIDFSLTFKEIISRQPEEFFRFLSQNQ